MKTALITGITGQDGAHLSRQLLEKGYKVIGVKRDASNTAHLDDIKSRITFFTCDLENVGEISVLLEKTQPDEVYNLAAQSFRPGGMAFAPYTFRFNAVVPINILEAISTVNKKIRMFQPSTSGIFGNVEGPCNESMPITPQSPYDTSKAAAHLMCRFYRQRGIWVSTAICFSHESKYRSPEMITRKLSMAVARWYVGDITHELRVGDLHIPRDVGYAGNFTKAFHASLQQEQPDDYVLGSGVLSTAYEFFVILCEIAKVNVQDMPWVVDERFIRPANTAVVSYADTTRARTVLKWTDNLNLQDIAQEMFDEDVRILRKA